MIHTRRVVTANVRSMTKNVFLRFSRLPSYHNRIRFLGRLTRRRIRINIIYWISVVCVSRNCIRFTTDGNDPLNTNFFSRGQRLQTETQQHSACFDRVRFTRDGYTRARGFCRHPPSDFDHGPLRTRKVYDHCRRTRTRLRVNDSSSPNRNRNVEFRRSCQTDETRRENDEKPIFPVLRLYRTKYSYTVSGTIEIDRSVVCSGPADKATQ